MLYALGITAKMAAQIVFLGGGAMCAAMYKEAKAREEERIKEETKEMNNIKAQIKLDLFSEEQEQENEEIKKAYTQMTIDDKRDKVDTRALIDYAKAEKLIFKGVKCSPNELLLGYTKDGAPFFGYDTNYIIAGTTGAGKTRKLYALLLNYLVNKQGTVYLADLKGTDFKRFEHCAGVADYCDDLDGISNLVGAFEKEYNARRDLISSKGYLDIDDYNKNEPIPLKPFMLFIDEYADISDKYKGRNGAPIGPYETIIRLARKCRAFGGRIVLGTQRPSADVIAGTLKNNCNIVGMKCLNELNSKIMIDVEGCERLEKTEALGVFNGELIKLFAYTIDDERLNYCISKLH